MKARIVILGTIALAFLIAGGAALWAGVGLMLEFQEPPSALIEDEEEWASRQVWLNMLYQSGGPLVGAGLIAGVGALALVVRGRQLAETRTETPARSPAASPRQG